MKTINGAHVDLSQGKILEPKPPQVEFHEDVLRHVIDQTKMEIARHGGALPIVDPTGNVIFGLVLDKLDAISLRLQKLESMLGGSQASAGAVPHE